MHIRYEKIDLIGRTIPFRALYASDLHFHGSLSTTVTTQIMEIVRTELPDRVVLGGDLLDSKRGEAYLEEMIRELTKICPVIAIAGNHDSFVGTDFVQSIVEGAGGTWHGDTVRMSVENEDSSATANVVCVHDPVMFESEVTDGANVVVAGHLHGGQFVWFQRGDVLFPGKLFHKWNRLRYEANGKVMLVSRGVNDTLPIRWNCPREVILCEIS